MESLCEVYYLKRTRLAKKLDKQLELAAASQCNLNRELALLCLGAFCLSKQNCGQIK